MIEKLWIHVAQTLGNTVPVDQPYKHNIRSQIFCQNQDEHDYLSALNLMHGRNIEIHIWDEWRSLRNELLANNVGRMRVLPIAYTTWHCSLRGF